MRALAAVLVLVLAGCARGAVPAPAPAPAADSAGAPAVRPAEPSPDSPQDTTRPPAPRRRVAPPEAAARLGLMPVASTGVDVWRRAHPTFDGRGVLIAILDSGVDPSIAGLAVTSTGERKILDLREFSGEGDVALTRVRPEGDRLVIGGLSVAGAAAVAQVARDTAWWGGVLEELPFGDMPASDFNGDGDNRDRYAVVVVRAADRWVAFVDANGDGSLADERPIGDFLGHYETFTFASRRIPRGSGPITAAVNLEERGGAPSLSIYLDTSGHGSHVAGIAAGRGIYGVPGFDGVAPGAQIIGLKIANNARGGVTTNGSMLRAMEYAVRFARERSLPLVINLSFGIGNAQEGRAVMDSVVDAFLMRNPDVAMAIAAGNDGPGTSTVGLPGSAEYAISVGAIYPASFFAVQFDGLPRDLLGWWSSRGGEAAKPDVLAPGIAYSTVPSWDNGGEIKVGTSMATPHVSGLLALLQSALLQSGRRASGEELKDALLATARGMGEPFIDQGYGVANIEAAWRWLESRRFAPRLRVEAMLPGPRPGQPDPDVNRATRVPATQAAYRRNGLASPGDTLQRFRVSMAAPEGPLPVEWRTFRLVSDAPWLQALSPQVVIDSITRSAVVTLRYDARALARPGRYSASVHGLPISDTAAGPAFTLANTIVVPHSGRALAASEERLQAGRAARYYISVPGDPAGLNVAVRVRNQAMQATAYVFEPTGMPLRGRGRADVGGEEGELEASFTIGAGDVQPGVYELVVQAGPGSDIVFDIRAAIPPLRIQEPLPRPGADSVVVRSVEAPDTSIALEIAAIGAQRTWVVDLGGGRTVAERLDVPAWARRVVVDVEMAPSMWNHVTDLALTLFDPEGSQLGNEPMNYPFARLEADLPRTLPEGYQVTLELFPGFAVTPPSRYEMTVTVRFEAEPRSQAAAGTTLSIPRGGRAAVALGASPLPAPPGFAPAFRVRSGSGLAAVERVIVRAPGR